MCVVRVCMFVPCEVLESGQWGSWSQRVCVCAYVCVWLVPHCLLGPRQLGSSTSACSLVFVVVVVVAFVIAVNMAIEVRVQFGLVLAMSF